MNCHHAVAGFGNPLLDMSIKANGSLNLNNILILYNLNPDGQKEVNGEELNEILALIEK